MTPSLSDFLARARDANPGVPDTELTEYWERTYASQGAAPRLEFEDAPSLEAFLKKAVPANKDVPERELVAYWLENYATAPQKAAKRTWGEAAKDLGASFGTGAGALVEGAGAVYGLVTGDMDNAARELGAGAREHWQARKSERLQALERQRAERVAEADGFFDEAGTAISETVRNPALLSSFVAEQAPMVVGPALAGRAGGAVARMAGASEPAAAAVATGSALAGGAVMQGGDIGGDAYEQALRIALEQGKPQEQAEAEALEVARKAAPAAGAISVGAQFLPGGRTIERALSGVKGRTVGRLSGALRGGVGEGLSEAVEEGAGKVASNLAMRDLDPTIPALQGAGEAAGLGLIGAGVIGAGAGALEARASAKPNIEPPTIEPPEDILGAQSVDEAIRAAEAALDEPKALPHYAGPEMVVFPDGTTMTAGEARQARADGFTFAPQPEPTVEPPLDTPAITPFAYDPAVQGLEGKPDTAALRRDPAPLETPEIAVPGEPSPSAPPVAPITSERDLYAEALAKSQRGELLTAYERVLLDNPPATPAIIMPGAVHSRKTMPELILAAKLTRSPENRAAINAEIERRAGVLLDAAPPAQTDDDRLAAKRAIYEAHKRTGAPDDIASIAVMRAQDRANERGEPMTLWRAPSGTLGLAPASAKSPLRNAEKVTTIHPEQAAIPAKAALGQVAAERSSGRSGPASPEASAALDVESMQAIEGPQAVPFRSATETPQIRNATSVTTDVTQPLPPEAVPEEGFPTPYARAGAPEFLQSTPQAAQPVTISTPQFDDFEAKDGQVKTFTTAAMALAFQRQGGRRVAAAYTPRQLEDGQWALSRLAPAPVVAAQIEAERRASRMAIQVADSAETIVKKSGGWSWADAAADGLDPAERKAKPFLFRTNGGLTIDGIAEVLDANGFDVRDETGAIDANKAREIMEDSFSGPVYSPEGAEIRAAMEAEAKARFEARSTPAERQDWGYAEADSDIQAAIAEAVEDDPMAIMHAYESAQSREVITDEELDRWAAEEAWARGDSEGPAAEQAPEGPGDRQEGSRETEAQPVDPQRDLRVRTSSYETLPTLGDLLRRSRGKAQIYEEAASSRSEAPASDAVRGEGSGVRGIRWLARGITDHLHQEGATSLVGRVVRSPKDLAELAQVYRNPRYEVFRIFFTKGRKIVHATGVSARLPDQSRIFPDNLSAKQGVAWMRRQMKKSGADGYWILHNHPSGDPSPSKADAEVTAALAQMLPGFKGHVVIDHNKFAYLAVDRSGAAISAVVDAPELAAEDLHTPAMPHGGLGEQPRSPLGVASIGVRLQRDDWITLIGQTGNRGVQGIAEIHLSEWSHPARSRAALRSFARRSGSQILFVYGKKADIHSIGQDELNALVLDGFATDIVWGDGWIDEAISLQLRQYGKGNFGATPTQFVREETSRPALELTGETEDEIRARAAAENNAADEKRRREAVPEPESFILTGSDRAADEAEARGQKPLFARFAAHQSAATKLPVFTNDEVSLARARLAKTQPIERGLQRVAFDILDSRIFKESVKALGIERAMARAKAGEVLLVMRGNEFHALDNIEIYPAMRGRGYGEQVVRSMLDSQDSPVMIRDIQPDAVAFWVKMGAKFPRSSEYMEASLDRFQYSAFQSKRGKDGARPETLERDDERREEGARGEAPGRDEGRETGPEGRQPRDTGRGPGFNRQAELAPRKGLGVGLVREIAATVSIDWTNAPDIHVLDTIDEAPLAVRRENTQQLTHGAAGVPQAFFHEGAVYLIASELPTVDATVRALFHEALGHYGLRGVFGEKLNVLLGQLAAARQGEVRAKAEEYGLDVLKREDRLLAAEEMLAELASFRPEITFVRKAIAIIRNWLRTHGLDMLSWTDDDIIQALILPARAFVERGSGRAPTAGTAFSRTMPGWIATGSPALKAVAAKIDTYAPDKTFNEKIGVLAGTWKERLVQGVFDAYAPLKRLGQKEYVLARMTRAADGALEGMLLYGKPVMGDDGAIHGQIDHKGFLGAMQELKGEHDRFLLWVAGNRAGRLLEETWRVTYPETEAGNQAIRYFGSEEEAAAIAKDHPGATIAPAGREHLFTADEIKAMKGLINGKMKDGSSRPQAYAKAAAALREYNKAVLDIAEKTGLIDPEARHTWETEFYIPFFRVDEDFKIDGPSKVKGLVRQDVLKRLKGGRENLGDLMHNTMRNWSHLLSASLANQAAVANLKAAEKVGIAREVPAGTEGATFAMVNGERVHYEVDDPFILDAISAMESTSFKGLPMKVMRGFKRALTLGVTISPTFRIRNLLRDSIAAIGQNEMNYDVLSNLVKGFEGTSRKGDEYAQMLFSGALMRFGQLTDGRHAEHVKRLIDAGVADSTILDTPQKVRAVLGKFWDEWQEIGDRMENVNRAALYKKLKAEGKTDLEAAYAARDMIDFSLQGSSVAVRFLSQTVPFLNARLQGFYKMGRAAKDNPARLGYVLGAVSLASIALLLAYQDDDDWKARADWDRDLFWWFKVGDVAYRLPKPFEIGAIGTLAERSVEMMISDEMTGERFGERLKLMLGDTFALNPVPQFFKPMFDLYANKDSFTGRQIESQSMEGLSKSERLTPTTSLVARVLGAAGDTTGFSPVQVDHLIRGYLGWLGTHVAMTADLMAQPFMATEKPAMKLDDYFVVGDFAKEMPARSSRYVDQFYKQSQAIQEVMGDLRAAREAHDLEKVKEILEDKGADVALSRLYSRAQARLREVNRQIRLVYSSPKSAQEKRDDVDRLIILRNQIARMVDERARQYRQSEGQGR